jgi:HSP20 family molecular chaperone IbpA
LAPGVPSFGRRFGSFARSVDLPRGVTEDAIKALVRQA